MEYLDFREALMRHVCIDVLDKTFGLDKEINCEAIEIIDYRFITPKRGSCTTFFYHNKILWCLRCSTMLLLSLVGISL